MVYVISNDIVVQYNIQSISQSVWSVQFVVHLDRGMGLCGLLNEMNRALGHLCAHIG